jgi:predicted transcriptional regulator
LKELTDAGLIKIQSIEGKKLFRTTSKGLKYLDYYDWLLQFMTPEFEE